MDKALRDKGLANRKAVLGEDYVNKSMSSADGFNGPFQEILNEYCWGTIWSDDRLPHKTRSMLNLVIAPACTLRVGKIEVTSAATWSDFMRNVSPFGSMSCNRRAPPADQPFVMMTRP